MNLNEKVCPGCYQEYTIQFLDIGTKFARGHCESCGRDYSLTSAPKIVEERFKAVLYASVERMIDESLSAVSIEQIWLHLRPQAAKKLVQSEEIQTYLKSDSFSLSGPGADLFDMGNGLFLPNRLYGLKVFIPNVSPVRAVTDNGILIHRIVPAAYLYWCPGVDPKEAWYMALEYQF